MSDDEWAKTFRQLSIQGRRLRQMIGASPPGTRDVRLLIEAHRLLNLAEALAKLSPKTRE